MRPVIFDCDGVLVDSEALAWDAWRGVLAEFGVSPSPQDIATLTGRTERDAYEHFVSSGSLPVYEDFSRLLADAIAEKFEGSLQAFEDAKDTLEVLFERGTSLAVASSSRRDRLDLALRATGIGEFFAVSVAGDEVEKGKPDPDLFLEAARRLHVDPGDCVVIEDTPAGVEAGRSAGMLVIAVLRGCFDPGELSKAHRVVPRLTPAAVLDL